MLLGVVLGLLFCFETVLTLRSSVIFDTFSNLPFLGKLCELEVAAQCKEHIASNDLFEEFQSGFRSNHSHEKALLSVTN